MRPALRLPVTAAAVTGLSVSGHMLGGGSSPAPVAVALVAVLATMVAALLAVRPRTPRVGTLAALFGGTQVVAHLLLHHIAGAGPVPVEALAARTHHAATAAHATHALAAASTSPAHAHVGESLQAAHGLSPLMVTSHLLATVLLAWLVGPARGHLRAVVRRVLTLPWSRPIDLVIPPRPVALPGPLAFLTRAIGACLTQRGPPRFVCT